MKKIKAFLLSFVLLYSCASVKPYQNEEYEYKEIKTKDYVLASWQKNSDNISTIKIYIEGDGNAYDLRGNPTKNPTPKDAFFRNLAFNDKSENVVYIARPGQFIKNENCEVKEWTSERFSRKNIDNIAQAIKTVAKDAEIILVGYSGGALISGIIINENSDLKIKKWITVAGLFDHKEWTQRLKYRPLVNSVNLDKIPTIKQIHFIGKKDTVIPYDLSIKRLPKDSIVIVEKASHNKGFEEIYEQIWSLE